MLWTVPLAGFPIPPTIYVVDFTSSLRRLRVLLAAVLTGVLLSAVPAHAEDEDPLARHLSGVLGRVGITATSSDLAEALASILPPSPSASASPSAPITTVESATQLSTTDAPYAAAPTTATTEPTAVGPRSAEESVTSDDNIVASDGRVSPPTTSQPSRRTGNTLPPPIPVSEDGATTYQPSDTVLHHDDDPGPSLPPVDYDLLVASTLTAPAFVSGGPASPPVGIISTDVLGLTPGISATCPVAGPHNFISSWGFARSGGRKHRGNDIFADEGTPLVAIASGSILRVDPVDNYRVGSGRGDLGGITLWLVDDGGTAYYYAHMLSIAPGITAGTRVEVGQLVGYVGRTGNAATTPPHLHFQIHPGGGEAVDPYPVLSQLCDGAR